MSRDYGRVSVAFWGDPEIQALGDQGKLLALYLLTGPHTNASGCFRLPMGYVMEDMDWSAETVNRTVGELLRNGFICYDPGTKWLVLPNFLKHNRPANPNGVKALCRFIDQIPEEAAHALELEKVFEPFHKLFENGCWNRWLNRWRTVSERVDLTPLERSAKSASAETASVKPTSSDKPLEQSNISNGFATVTPTVPEQEVEVEVDKEVEVEEDSHKPPLSESDIRETVKTAPPNGGSVDDRRPTEADLAIPEPLQRWVQLGNKLLKITGLDQATRPVPITIVQQWLADTDEQTILRAVNEAVQQGGYRTPNSLKYFQPVIERAIEAKRAEDEASLKWGDLVRDRHFWVEFMKAWARGEHWARSTRGPAPNEPGFRGPPDLLDQYRAKWGDLEPGHLKPADDEPRRASG